MSKVKKNVIIVILTLLSFIAYASYGEIIIGVIAACFYVYYFVSLFKEKEDKINELTNEKMAIINDTKALLALANFVFLETDLRKRKQARIAGSFFNYDEFDKKLWFKVSGSKKEFWDDEYYDDNFENENKIEYFKMKFISKIERLNTNYGFDPHLNIERKNELFLKRWEHFLSNDRRNN